MSEQEGWCKWCRAYGNVHDASKHQRDIFGNPKFGYPTTRHYCRVCGKPIRKRLDVGLCYRHRFDS